VPEGGTRRRGAHGGDGELRGEPGAVLHGGSTVAEQGGVVEAMGGGRKAVHRGEGGAAANPGAKKRRRETVGAASQRRPWSKVVGAVRASSGL
jgi:hypothetical protein